MAHAFVGYLTPVHPLALIAAGRELERRRQREPDRPHTRIEQQPTSATAHARLAVRRSNAATPSHRPGRRRASLSVPQHDDPDALLEGLPVDALLSVVVAATRRLQNELPRHSRSTETPVAHTAVGEVAKDSTATRESPLTVDLASRLSTNPPRRVLRAPEVIRRTGLSRTTIWRQIQAGEFPTPRRLGKNAIGWDEEDVTRWLAARPPTRP